MTDSTRPVGRFTIRYGDHVTRARRDGRPVVALESTIVSHGLPRPDNLRVAREIEQTVRDNGAVPATIGMIGGELIVGLEDAQIEHLAGADGVAKLSVRDLAVAAASGADGATTVAATSAVAAAAGIGVFATGGLGGVHREANATFDESADLTTLARTPIVVVCAGVKSILDVGATLERLETLGVSVAGYGTRRFPGFFVTDGGFDVDWELGSPAQVAAVMAAREEQGVGAGALVLGNPLPVDEQLDPELHDRTLAEGLELLARDGITGKAVTPFLLAHFHSSTEGRSLEVNVRIILRNAALAAQIAAAVEATPGAVHLHLSGYPLLHAGSRPGGLAALAAARERGLTTSVDAASAAPLRQAGGFLELVRGTDLLLCNADEAQVLAGPGRPEDQAEVLTAYARNVVVKRGGDGAVWKVRDGVLRSVTGVRVPSIDPTGAGDAFAAGLLRAWCCGAEPQAALEAGAALGAAAVQRVGARP